MMTSSTSYPHWTQVYGEVAGKDEYPRVYRSPNNYVRAFVEAGRPAALFMHDRNCGDSSAEESECLFHTLLTGPEAAEYVAAAREGRDAVWPPKDADPWPHWWTRKDGAIEWLWEVSSDGAVIRHDEHEAVNQVVAKNGDLLASEYGHRRIPAPEAAALLAKWEGKRKSEGEKRTEKWFTKEETERRVGEIVASVKPADPRRRVKHTWTGKCGSIITIHGGIAFVDWDGEDASSMFLGLLVDEDAKPPVPEVSPPALPGAELPTPEAIATEFVNSQCGIGRPAVADPDQQVRLSYVVGLIANAIHRDRRLRGGNAILQSKIAKMEKHLRWIAYEPIGPANNTAEAILDEITNTTRAVIFELAKPECRVKHDWTGAMGTVLMEHDGTAFVKWDDGQVTSVYNRHLQKELE